MSLLVSGVVVLAALRLLGGLDGRRSQALIRRALAGDRKARRRLARRLFPVVNAHARRYLARHWAGPLSEADADDIVQQTWIALIKEEGRQLRAWEPSRGASLEGYVGLIVEREAGNLLQRRRAQRRGGGQAPVPLDDVQPRAGAGSNPEAEAMAAQLGEALVAHLDEALPPRGQLVFRYLYEERRSPRDAAEIIGVTPQVIYNWQHKIRSAARAFLELQGSELASALG